MVELRRSKRKAADSTPAAAVPPPAKKNTAAKAAEKTKEASKPREKEKEQTNGKAAAPSSRKVAVGDVIDVDTFGGEFETNEGESTSLKKLVDASKSGVVLFTYPKASTPGCTTQVCLFRDSYAPLTATGLSIYGLSADSPKANTTFKTKQRLPYALLCDPRQTLISAIGMKKPPKGTARGVFVVGKLGEVLAVENGGPAATVEVVKKLVENAASTGSEEKEEVEQAGEKALAVETSEEVEPVNGDASKQDAEKAEVAADVADTAEELDAEK